MFSKITLLSVPLATAQVGHGEAKFFWDGGYRGENFSMKLGQDHDATEDEHWNDNISSFQLGAGTKLTLCKDSGCSNPLYGGSSSVYGPMDVPDMTSLGDEVSHIKLENWSGKAMMLFKDSECRVGYANIFEAGFYDTEDLKSHHIGNDEASGYVLDYGVEATFFKDGDYEGEKHHVVGPATSCNKMGGLGNDELSSMIITVDPNVSTSGNWAISASGNSDISGTMTSSVMTSSSHTLAKSDTTHISESIDAGFSFLGLGVDYSTSHTTTSVVTKIIEEGTTRSCSAQCVNPKSEPVTLYQW
jgi:hypothetical protein